MIELTTILTILADITLLFFIMILLIWYKYTSHKSKIKKMFKNIDEILGNNSYNVVEKLTEVETELDYWRDHIE